MLFLRAIYRFLNLQITFINKVTWCGIKNKVTFILYSYLVDSNLILFRCKIILQREHSCEKREET